MKKYLIIMVATIGLVQSVGALKVLETGNIQGMTLKELVDECRSIIDNGTTPPSLNVNKDGKWQPQAIGDGRKAFDYTVAFSDETNKKLFEEKMGLINMDKVNQSRDPYNFEFLKKDPKTRAAVFTNPVEQSISVPLTNKSSIKIKLVIKLLDQCNKDDKGGYNRNCLRFPLALTSQPVSAIKDAAAKDLLEQKALLL